MGAIISRLSSAWISTWISASAKMSRSSRAVYKGLQGTAWAPAAWMANIAMQMSSELPRTMPTRLSRAPSATSSSANQATQRRYCA
jgi:hypothetical protein